MKCKICEQTILFYFNTLVLQKYDVSYYRCPKCYFIQTENPYWLDESYNSVITKLDLGLIHRNLTFASKIEGMLKKHFNVNEKFLDYGGGYGMFVRMMRDRGFDFYRYDKYCPNIFSEFFDFDDLPPKQFFEAVTTFEVFEHLIDPVSELLKILSFTDNIIFSTELQPIDPTPENWWYFVPETGQHISLFSLSSLVELSKKLKLHFYTNGSSLHVFTREPLKEDPFKKKSKSHFLLFRKKQKPIELESLLIKDFNYVKEKLLSSAGKKN